MPQYMLLIFSDPSQGPAEGSPEAMAEWQAWGTYTQGLKDAGVFVSGEPLEAAVDGDDRRGARRRARGHRRAVRRDQGMAGRLLRHRGARTSTSRSTTPPACPTSAYGHVEVRPLMQVPAM